MSFQPIGVRSLGGLFPGPSTPKFVYREDSLRDAKGNVQKWIGRWTFSDSDSTLGQVIVDTLHEENIPHHSFSAYQLAEPSEMKMNLECHSFPPCKPQVLLHTALQRILAQCDALKQQVEAAAKVDASVQMTKATQAFVDQPKSKAPVAQSTESISATATATALMDIVVDTSDSSKVQTSSSPASSLPSAVIITKPKHPISLTLLEADARHWIVQLEHTHKGFVNGIRRTVNGFVPCLAIARVQIAVNGNTSVMGDDILAHRLRMLPIRSTVGVKRLVFPDECNCGDGCSKCQVKMTLNVTNTNKTRSIEVTDLDIVSDDPTVGPTSQFDTTRRTDLVYADGHVFDSHGITLLKLGPGQHVKLVAFVRKGLPTYDAAYGSAQIGYRPKLQVTLNAEVLAKAKLTSDEQKQFVKTCSSHVFGLRKATENNAADVEELFVQNTNLCNGCRECFSANALLLRERKMDPKLQSIVSVEQVPGNFRMFVENDSGSLSPAHCLILGIRELRSMIINTMKQNASAKPTTEIVYNMTV